MIILHYLFIYFTLKDRSSNDFNSILPLHFLHESILETQFFFKIEIVGNQCGILIVLLQLKERDLMKLSQNSDVGLNLLMIGVMWFASKITPLLGYSMRFYKNIYCRDC